MDNEGREKIALFRFLVISPFVCWYCAPVWCTVVHHASKTAKDPKSYYLAGTPRVCQFSA